MQLWVDTRPTGPPRATRMNPVRLARGWPKPLGGLWTSPWNSDTRTAPYTELLRRRSATERRPDWALTAARAPRYLLVENPAARILHINEPHDLTDLPRHADTILDFPALAFDGVHLTAKAAAAGLLPEWECETVFWLRWSFAPAAWEKP